VLAETNPHVVCPTCRQLVSASFDWCGMCRNPLDGPVPSDPSPGAVLKEAREVLAACAAPAPHDGARSNGERCVRAYFAALAGKQWKSAFEMLSVFARRRTATVPDVPGFRTHHELMPLAAPRDLKRYWRKIIRSDLGNLQSVKQVSVVPRGAADDLETYFVVLDVATAPLSQFAWILGGLAALLTMNARTTTFRLGFESAVVKHDSQWWMLTGELCSATDRRISAALRAAPPPPASGVGLS
jgi:hypothetical protein